MEKFKDYIVSEAAMTSEQKEVKKILTKEFKKYGVTIKKRTKKEIKDSDSYAEYKAIIPVVYSNYEEGDEMGEWSRDVSIDTNASTIENIIDNIEGVSSRGTDYTSVQYQNVVQRARYINALQTVGYDTNIENIIYFDFTV